MLIEDSTKQPGSLNHLGVEVESREEVAAAQGRLAEAGLATATEDEVACCYAVQDKVWVDGPGGEPWEIYTVLADAEMRRPGNYAWKPRAGAACCATRPTSPFPARQRRAADSRHRVVESWRSTEYAVWRRLAAEFLGSAFLAAVVIGSGIAAQRLSPGNVGLQLFENAAATAAGLFAIILMFGLSP